MKVLFCEGKACHYESGLRGSRGFEYWGCKPGSCIHSQYLGWKGASPLECWPNKIMADIAVPKWKIQHTDFISSVNFESMEPLPVVEKRKEHWTWRQRTGLPVLLPLVCCVGLCKPLNFSELSFFIDKIVMIRERSLESLHFLGVWDWIF